MHGPARNPHDLHRAYELSSSSKSSKKSQNDWDVEANVSDQKTVDSKSEMSFERRSSTGGDSMEFIIQGIEKDMAGVTVSTTYQVSIEDANKAAQWNYGMGGGSSRASVHARSHG